MHCRSLSFVTSALLCLMVYPQWATGQGDSLLDRLAQAPARVVLTEGTSTPDGIRVVIHREGPTYHSALINHTPYPLRIKEVVLFEFEHDLSDDTAFYGEAYSMLSQTAGTLAHMVDVDPLTDRGHYRLPEPEGMRTVYGMMHVTPPGGKTTVLGFGSCRRFTGKFNVNADRIQVVIDTENLVLHPAQRWELEEFMAITGPNKSQLLKRLAERIDIHHPRLPWPELPTGWCSWYCFGPNVTAAQVLDNLRAFKKHLPGIRFIQIDDGYQPWMGDWLESTDRFANGVQDVVRRIREMGFEPAIWVGPFIASPQSKLFHEHPDWFVKDAQGHPLASDKVTFGGWRQGPWYMLDGTHPDAQAYIERVFRIMHEQWGCTYFKLDANMWGAMPFGQRYDENATAVEAYRRGMAAVRRGAGDSYILGCNHPMWASLGEIHGSRSSMDVGRSWGAWTRAARENLLRNWQNDHFWWNDPDCLVLTGPAPENEKLFHMTATYASGGMLLSGDDVTIYSATQWDLLRKAASNPGVAALFPDSDLNVGLIDQDQCRLAVFLNWTNQASDRSIALPGRTTVTDFWTGENLGVFTGKYTIRKMPPKSGRLLMLKPGSTP